MLQPDQVLVGWGNLRVVTTGWHRVVTTLLAQGWAATVRLDCSSFDVGLRRVDP